MGLESATYISQLVTTNPVGATDPKSQGDDHLRLLKLVLQAQFPNLGAAAVTATAAQINTVIASGVTGFANPTASAGPTAVNGAALTAMRSDAAPAINLTANYTWTGTHAFAVNKFSVNGIGFNGLTTPSVTVGLTAKPGTALTAIRSDGAPALDQAITPVWTDQHRWSKSGSTKANGAAVISCAVPSFVMNNTGAATDSKQWERVIDALTLVERIVNDADNSVIDWLEVIRAASSLVLTSVNFPSGVLQYGGKEVGYRGFRQERAVSANGNTAATDAGGIILLTAGVTQFDLDTDIDTLGIVTIININAGAVTIRGSTDLTWYNGSALVVGNRTLGTGGVMSAYHSGGGHFQAWGNGGLS